MPKFTSRADLLTFLENGQPFVYGDPWLHDLCDARNRNKHRGIKQVRRNVGETATTIAGTLQLLGNAKINAGKFVIDGVPVAEGKPVKLDGAAPLSKLRQSLPGVQIAREFEEVEFLIQGANLDAISLIRESLDKVRAFEAELYRIL